MRKLLIFAAILAVPVTAAEAKCTKKSLNGNWVMGIGSEAAAGAMSGGSFSFSIPGVALSFTLTSFNSTTCKGSGSGLINASPYTVKVASEAIASSAAKPNHLLVSFFDGGDVFALPMHRQ